MWTRTHARSFCTSSIILAASCTLRPPISLPPDACPRPNTVIEGRDILAAGGASAFDGIRLLRIPPHRDPDVYVDGRRSSGVRILQMVHYSAVREMYYLTPAAPASCPGSGQPNGVIVVRTQVGR